MPAPIIGVVVLVTALWTVVASEMEETVVVYSQYTLSSNQTDSLTSGVIRSCMCRTLCAERNCSTYAVTEMGEANFLCQFSSSPVPLGDLQPQLSGIRSFVVHKSDFKHIGSDFYKTSTANTLVNRGVATSACNGVGGMLPVANTPELLAQLEEAMQVAGVRAVWLALIRNYVTGTSGPLTAPMWIFSNGTSVTDPAVQVQNSINRCYVLDLDQPAATRFNNIRTCGGPAGYICQRSY